ncbi:MAG TPA: hypothetical protein VF268_05555 [Gammaproteobacteria bacterium]
MKTHEINLTATRGDGDVFTVEKAGNGKATVIYNANRVFDTQTGLPAGCGLLSRLAETSLTAAGMSILGKAITREMEIEMLADISDTRWHRLQAVARVIDAEEDFATVRCEIRIDKNGKSKPLVARAFGTICRVKKPFHKTDPGRVIPLRSGSGGRRAAG